MQHSNYRISLDIQTGGSGVVLSAKRGDTGRRLFTTLTDGGRAYCPDGDCMAVFAARKPDGHIVFLDCTLEGGQLCCAFSEQLLAVPGVAKCELRLYGKDNMLLTSAGFDLLVEDTVYREGEEMESFDDFSALTALIGQNQQILAELLALKENPDFPAGGGTVTSVNGVQPDENGNVQIETGVTPEEVLEALPAVTAVDFSAFDRGSFTETVDGEATVHAVTFDEQGRPTAIDDIAITWGDAL